MTSMYRLVRAFWCRIFPVDDGDIASVQRLYHVDPVARTHDEIPCQRYSSQRVGRDQRRQQSIDGRLEPASVDRAEAGQGGEGARRHGTEEPGTIEVDCLDVVEPG